MTRILLFFFSLKPPFLYSYKLKPLTSALQSSTKKSKSFYMNLIYFFIRLYYLHITLFINMSIKLKIENRFHKFRCKWFLILKNILSTGY